MSLAVFVDLDGTLCESDTVWNRAVEETFSAFLTEHSWITREQVSTAWAAVHRSLLGDLESGSRTMAEVRDLRFHQTLEALGILDTKQADDLNIRLGQALLAYLRLYDDVTALDRVRDEAHLGIITNGAGDDHPDSQLTKIRHLGLAERVDSIWISDQIGCRKPRIEIFMRACDGAGVEPRDTIYVGDSVPADIVGANRSGMTSVLVDRSLQHRKASHRDEIPEYTIRSLWEVLPILSAIGRKSL